MKLIAISVLAWLAGLGAYVAAAWLLWGQTISRGDLGAVLVWSGLATAASVVIAFAPAMFVLRSKLGGHPTWRWAYPSVGVLLGAIPVVLIMSVWSKDVFGALLSAEGGLFFCMFATFGAVFGVGFAGAYARRSA